MGQRVDAVLRQLENAQAFVQRPRETPTPVDFERELKRPAPTPEPAQPRRSTPSNDVRVDLRPRGQRSNNGPAEPGIREAEAAIQNLGRAPATLRRLEEIEFDAARVGDILVQARQAVSAAARGAATAREEVERVPLAESRSLTASRAREQTEQTARIGLRGTESVPVPERNAFVRGPVAQRLGVTRTPEELDLGPAVHEGAQRENPRRNAPPAVATDVPTPPRREEPQTAVEPQRRRSEEEVQRPPQRLQEALQGTVASSNIHQNVSGMGDIRPGNV